MKRNVGAVAVAVLLAALLVGVTWRGRDDRAVPQPTGAPSVGNPELARAAARILGDDHGDLAVVSITADSTRFAYLGAEPRQEYEIGSLTKVMTGQLLADAVARGEVTLDTPVGDLVELGDAPISVASLESLATYRSGLSLWGPGPPSRTGAWDEEVLVANPYEYRQVEMIDRAKADPLATKGRFSYSNIGLALLGTALADQAGTSYDELLADRLLEPLGMERTHVGRADDRNQSRGFTTDGRRSMPWNLRGFASAGGVRSTIEDMALWARSIMETPTGEYDTFKALHVDDEGNGVGLGNYTTTRNGDEIIWKTGQTGGFASLLVVDRTNQRALVVLSRSAVPFDEADLDLLDWEP